MEKVTKLPLNPHDFKHFIKDVNPQIRIGEEQNEIEILRCNLLFVSKDKLFSSVLEKEDANKIFEQAFSIFLDGLFLEKNKIDSYIDARKFFDRLLREKISNYFNRIIESIRSTEQKAQNNTANVLMNYLFSTYIPFLKRNLPQENIRTIFFADSFSDFILAVQSTRVKLENMLEVRKYFFGIVRNKLHEKYRDDKRLQLIGEEELDKHYAYKNDEGLSWLKMQIKKEEIECLELQLEKLRQKERNIIFDFYGHGKKHIEIANELKISVENCRKICSRSFASLKKLVQHYCA